MLVALLQSAAQHSRSTVTIGDQHFTFDELLERSLRVATSLSNIGIGEHDRVAVILPNSLEFLVAVFAINAIGAVSLPLNPAYEREELRHYFGLVGVAAVICSNANVGKHQKQLQQFGMSSYVIACTPGTAADYDLDALMRAPAAVRVRSWAADDVALFLHTSGTIGRPKLVPRTSRQISAAAAILCRALDTTGDDVILCTVPLFHGQGFTNCLVATLQARASLVVPVDLMLARDLERVLRMLEAQRVTIWPSVPMVFDLLSRSTHTANLVALRLCMSGGTNLPRETFDRFRARFGVPIRQFYGCSEAGAVTANLEDDVAASAETVGRPFSGIQIDVDNPDESGAGDIVIRSPTLTDGYWKLDDLNRETFINGGFRTGDIGRLDGVGRLSLTGRRRPFIDVAGFKVDPLEIEDVLLTLPGVREAVVVGDESSLGRLLKAVIVVDSPLSSDAVRRFCRERLATFKIPNVIEFRSEIPRNASGKIMRKDLV